MLLSCWTGLAFADVFTLSPENLEQDNNGDWWIRKGRVKLEHRRKDSSISNIPLLPVPLAILKKYENNPICIKNNKCLPVLSNQKMNSYLKEIADLCNVKKNLTTHAARHLNSSYSLKTRNLQRLSTWQVTTWKPAGFCILQCSALIKRTLLSSAKVMFFSLITKVIPLKNRENLT